jgi:hypothetical protein
MAFNVDELLTGILPPYTFQDAQEIPYEWPLSVSEILQIVKDREPLDIYDARLAFATLVRSFNNMAAFNAITAQAVQCIRNPSNPDILPAILHEVDAAMVAPPPPKISNMELHDAYSHVLPAVDSGCRALLADSIADPDQFAEDLAHIAALTHLSSFRAAEGVCNYVRAALPSINAYWEVPALGADFDFNGIPLHAYQALGAALLAAVKGEEI